jgi:hypothetical protein
MRTLAKKIVPRALTQQNAFQLYLHEYQAYDLLKKYQVPLVTVISSPCRASGQTLQKTRLRSPSE